ncbi:hypothetical protein HK097_008367 [Rhizophlyctis rosea]|uniref:Uncharacterized protein n=1 Tax=Rhizophlyctis rosea TaxID=64517 RepID=A0AAD5SJH8_9FUNG|nr:hypothetical protein HK097_008367 [Rhizophlyctis rosea]
MSREKLDPILEGSATSVVSNASSHPSAGVRRGSNAAHSLTSRRASLSDDQLQRSLSRHHSPLGSTSVSDGSTGTLRKATSVASPGVPSQGAAANSLGVPVPLNPARRKSQDRSSLPNIGITNENADRAIAHNPANYNITTKSPKSNTVTSSANVNSSTDGSGTLVDLAPSQQLWTSSLNLLKARQARLAASGIPEGPDGKGRLSPAADHNESRESRMAMIGWGMGDDSDISGSEDDGKMKMGRGRSMQSSRPPSIQKSTSSKCRRTRSGTSGSKKKKRRAGSGAPSISSSITSATSASESSTLGRNRHPSTPPPALAVEREKHRGLMNKLKKQIKRIWLGTNRVGVLTVGGMTRTSRSDLNTFW